MGISFLASFAVSADKLHLASVCNWSDYFLLRKSSVKPRVVSVHRYVLAVTLLVLQTISILISDSFETTILKTGNEKQNIYCKLKIWELPSSIFLAGIV